MSDRITGHCDRCPRPTIVVINGTQACADHLDEVMAEAFAVIRDHYDPPSG